MLKQFSSNQNTVNLFSNKKTYFTEIGPISDELTDFMLWLKFNWINYIATDLKYLIDFKENKSNYQTKIAILWFHEIFNWNLDKITHFTVEKCHLNSKAHLGGFRSFSVDFGRSI